MTAAQHAARGTYRPGVHGPLPPGVVPVSTPRARPALVARGRSAGAAAVAAPEPVARLTAADCPSVLTEAGRAFWGLLVATRPTEVLHGQILTVYVQAWEDWARATAAIAASGDLVKVNKRPVPNPYLRLRDAAAVTMLRTAGFLGWQAAAVQAEGTQQPEAPATKLGLFLASRGRA